MTQKKKKEGQHDVNIIVLDQSSVKCADCINIINKKCSWPNYNIIMSLITLKSIPFVKIHTMAKFMLKLHLWLGKAR